VQGKEGALHGERRLRGARETVTNYLLKKRAFSGGKEGRVKAGKNNPRKKGAGEGGGGGVIARRRSALKPLLRRS